ncbi:MAG: multidrug effflux MFS transporter [Acidimicrobiales bacterium]|nr:multidrug effflux MFS transporter [Acidimicrobiales bacterium]
METADEIGRRELIALLAMATALTALGIDLMLPAFNDIRADLGLAADSTAVTGLVTAYFVGLGAGTIFYGPLADNRGRRWTMRLGLAIYIGGALLATVAPTLPTLFLARFLWGLGAAGPRVVALAVIRDRFDGDEMSKTMSSMMAIFILVPVVAPALGSAVLLIAPWRWLFALCAVWAVAIAVWVRRLPETLAPEHRIPDLRFHRVVTAARYVVSNRTAFSYAVGVTALYGVFSSYLGSAEAIFDKTFDAEGIFPLVFGALAAVMGCAALLNGRIVSTVGTTPMVVRALAGYGTGALLFVVVAVASGGRPPLVVFMVIMAVMLAFHALLLPNLNTLAMAPMAAVAGTASSVIGAFQLAIGASLGGVLDRFFDGTITPLAIGFVLSAAATTVAVFSARRADVAPATVVD